MLHSKIVHTFAPVPAKPLSNAQMCGVIFYIGMAKRKFIKSFTTPKELVKLLQSRGLEISDEQKAENYLKNIGYYRLSAYMYPFLRFPKELHQFKHGITFDKVMMLYRFDKKLRILLLNEIEKIEIAMREAVINITVEMTGDDFWLINRAHFSISQMFFDTLKLIDKEYSRSTEDYILHFKETYFDSYPPAWILGELLTMGCVNRIYHNLKEARVRKAISQRFGLQPKVFESWMTILVLLRNSCCHHARVWNRLSSVPPVLPKHISHSWITLPVNTQRIYFDICIIKYFLDVISPENDMLAKLQWLFVDYPEIDLRALGFPDGWEFEPLWK